jgi:thiol-disulfide isomerase/thioredoxin
LLGVIILIVGLLIVTGYIKKIEAFIIERNIFVNTFAIDNALNDIIIKNHNNVNNMCTNGKCDEGKEGNLMMDAARAPELTEIAAWINSEPLTLASLRGKVVLIDFWTYSCINCIRTQPYLNAWHEKYSSDGLVIIGVHAPEFAFEQIENNVREASQKAGIKYPIALDNNFATWNAYANRYWPAKYLIDQEWNIVYKHFWEGKYAETEEKIQSLLGMNNEEWIMKNGGLSNWENSSLSQGKKKTPETYLGSARAERINIPCRTSVGYCDGSQMALHEWSINEKTGNWKVTPEYIESVAWSLYSQLVLRFSAREVFLVASLSPEVSEGTMAITLNWKKFGTPIVVQKDDIYRLITGLEYLPDGLLELEVSPGVRLHAFTFWA